MEAFDPGVKERPRRDGEVGFVVDEGPERVVGMNGPDPNLDVRVGRLEGGDGRGGEVGTRRYRRGEADASANTGGSAARGIAAGGKRGMSTLERGERRGSGRSEVDPAR